MKKSFLCLIHAVVMALLAMAPAMAGEGTFETIRAAAETYVTGGRPFHIDAKTLYESMASSMPRSVDVRYYDPSSFKRGPIIIDLRNADPDMPHPYALGHIPGAIHIPWRKIAEWRYLKDLPKDRKLVVYSSTGQIGGQVSAILNILGFDAVNLMWGITSWTASADVAPGRYEKSRDTVWSSGGSFRTVIRINEPQETYELPNYEEKGSHGGFEAVLSAALLYLNALDKSFTISAPELDRLLNFSANPFLVPLVLDVRDDTAYRIGHIDNCLHITLGALFKRENLRRLPPGRQVVAYCETGHDSGQAAALLNLLGYDAVSLKWGISAWSLSLPGMSIAPNRYDEKRDCIDYEVVPGFRPSIPCPG
jgi:rhodanese-related sulfurtransferase